MELNNYDQRNAFLAAIIHDSEDAIISKDLTSRVTSWNVAAERMFGFSSEEMIGRPIHILIPDDRKGEEDVIIASLKRGERVDHFQTVRRRKDGRLLNISLTISPIKDNEGRIVGASKIARDITLQMENEESLRLINDVGKRIAAELDTDRILQIVIDATTRLSGAAIGIFCYQRQIIAGQVSGLFALSGATTDSFGHTNGTNAEFLFPPALKSGLIVRSDDIMSDETYASEQPQQGSPLANYQVASYLAVPVTSQEGAVIGGLFLSHPEPARFTARQETVVSAIAAQAAVALDKSRLYHEINLINTRKDDFIGFASHELKTPLSTIKGYIQLGEMNGMTVSQIYPKLIKQVERLQSLVTDLLDTSRVRAGALEYKMEKWSVRKLLEESLDTVDLSSHRIETDLPATDISIMVDGQKIMQVLVNLLTNAMKYSAKDTLVRISVIVHSGHVEYVVADQGPGMQPSELTQVFHQFYRVSRAEGAAQGMGLGLYICKEIIGAHLGSIWAESEVGKGSSFHIRLPIDRA